MKDFELKKAFKIGSVCILTYMLSYYMRNILSITTPKMLENGDFSKEFIATISSIYMISYAFGQFFNGFIGDVIKSKYMVLVGLSLAGVALVLFPFAAFPIVRICCFIVLGVGFSMLRGPIVKLASENTLPQYARVCCVILSTSYYVGPFIAGIFTLFFSWQMVFVFSGILAVMLATISFVVISIFEKIGLIVPMVREKKENSHTEYCLFSSCPIFVFIL